MKLVHFTFNNFFDYSIIVEQLKSKRWIFVSNNLTATFNYVHTEVYIVKHIKELCKPLNIQFTPTFEVTEDTE